MRINVEKSRQKIKEEIKDQIQGHVSNGERPPHLATVLVGNDGGSELYIKAKHSDTDDVCATSQDIRLDEMTTTKELCDIVVDLNNDKNVDGILVQLPLPKHINEEVVLNTISKNKDVDGFVSPLFEPCTPLGIIAVIEDQLGDISGKKILLIGRGKTVGEPLRDMLIGKDATLLVAHSKTKNLASVIYDYKPEIIITAAGKMGLIKGADIPMQTKLIIDAGITRVDGKQFGDIDVDSYELLDEKGVFYTYRVKGVGNMTTTMLVHNLYQAYLLNKKK